MNKFEGSRITGSSSNEKAVEEIRDYDNTAIRKMLEEADAIQPGDTVTPDDYEATRNRAVFLAQHRDTPISVGALLSAAFIDRKRHLDQFSDDAVKRMPNDILRAYIYAETGINLDDPSLEMLRGSELGLEEWVQKRSVVQENPAGEFDVAVNKEDVVIARGASPEEALRRAQEGPE